MAGTIHDLTGKKFGRLTVINRSERKYKNSRGIQWLCHCDCGKEAIVISHSLLCGRTQSCGCYGREVNWGGYEEISLSYWSHLQQSAEKRKHEFLISIEEAWEIYIRQNKKCALSGLPLDFIRDRKGKKQSASLDRINSKIGYVVGNVQWVHKDVNWIKQDFDEKYFLFLCENIVSHSKA